MRQGVINQTESQRSGFRLKRRSSDTSALRSLADGKRCIACFADGALQKPITKHYQSIYPQKTGSDYICQAKQASPEHFFYFDVPNVGEQVLKAVAGDCTDESFLRKVDVFNEAYRLVEKGAVLNWFDITMPEGYFSLNDKMSDIMATPEGMQMIGGFMAAMMPAPAEGGEGGKIEAAGFEIEMTPDSPMMAMMGGFLGKNFTKEELLGINAMLNRIKKPE